MMGAAMGTKQSAFFSMSAMMADQKEMVRYLICKGFKVSPINLAAFFGDLQKVQKLLTDGGNINAKDSAGFTPLHCAVCGGHNKVAEFLIAKGAEVNAKTDKGDTLLSLAKGDKVIIEMLRKHGAKE